MLLTTFAERIGTIQSVISRLEEGGGVRNRIDTLARVAEALDRHLVLAFPTEVPDTRQRRRPGRLRWPWKSSQKSHGPTGNSGQ